LPICWPGRSADAARAGTRCRSWYGWASPCNRQAGRWRPPGRSASGRRDGGDLGSVRGWGSSACARRGRRVCGDGSILTACTIAIMQSTGTLHIVATPIGNLGDLSSRALEVLGAVDAICAEDTRHTRQLLSHFGLERPLLALHQHNEDAQAEQLVARLQSGESLALVSDAGTPLVSDPGFRLVRAAREAGVRVSP